MLGLIKRSKRAKESEGELRNLRRRESENKFAETHSAAALVVAQAYRYAIMRNNREHHRPPPPASQRQTRWLRVPSHCQPLFAPRAIPSLSMPYLPGPSAGSTCSGIRPRPLPRQTRHVLTPARKQCDPALAVHAVPLPPPHQRARHVFDAVGRLSAPPLRQH